MFINKEDVIETISYSINYSMLDMKTKRFEKYREKKLNLYEIWFHRLDVVDILIKNNQEMIHLSEFLDYSEITIKINQFKKITGCTCDLLELDMYEIFMKEFYIIKAYIINILKHNNYIEEDLIISDMLTLITIYLNKNFKLKISTSIKIITNPKILMLCNEYKRYNKNNQELLHVFFNQLELSHLLNLDCEMEKNNKKLSKR